MINVLVLSPCNEIYKNKLASSSDKLSFEYVNPEASPEILKTAVQKAEIIVGEPDIDLIKHAPNLKFIQLTMAGTDKYTLSDDYPKNVILANASGAFGGVISQYVIGAILNICHKFNLYRDQQKIGLWKDLGLEINLSGKRVLIIGAGNIGSSVAKKLSVFDTFNVGIRRNINDIPNGFNEMHTLDELNDQLPLADVVVACIPNSDYTYHLFDKEKFLLMKKDSIFVNVGRGSLVVQEDLIDVLQSGHLSGAAIDVTVPEPLPSDSPLWKLDNLIITPHISGKSFGHSQEITDKIFDMCAKNLKNYAEGKDLINIIDFKKFRK